MRFFNWLTSVRSKHVVCFRSNRINVRIWNIYLIIANVYTTELKNLPLKL